MRTSSALLLVTFSVATACAFPELTQNPDYVEDGASGGVSSDGSGAAPSDGSGGTPGQTGGNGSGGNGPSGSCQPNDPPTCYDAVTPQSCSDEGQWTQQAPCDAERPHCDDATGTCVVCEANRTVCQDNTSVQCLPDGSGWTELEVCMSPRPSCLEETGACGICTAGHQSCIGDLIATCEEDGTWDQGVTCTGSESQCYMGACHECDPNEGNGRGCAGDVPRVCVDGTWQEEEECSGETPFCSPTTGRCVCGEGETRGDYICTGGEGREACIGGTWQRIEECGGWTCFNGACATAPSCEGMLDTECQGHPCCSTIALASIDDFPMGDGASDVSSHGPEHNVDLRPFALDKFEVTVGRFRAFIENFTIPSEGDGAVPGTDDLGWDPAWDALISPDHDGNCNEDARTWTDTVGINENKPMNCLTWPMAYAFCIWDDGRLPTEAEWEAVAIGGDENRTYPWGEVSPTCDLANVDGCFGAPQDIGLAAAGNARWGHSDMSGNLAEHVRDYLDHDFYTKPAASYPNPLNLEPGDYGQTVVRGGDHLSYDMMYERSNAGVDFDSWRFGVRCARDP